MSYKDRRPKSLVTGKIRVASDVNKIYLYQKLLECEKQVEDLKKQIEEMENDDDDGDIEEFLRQNINIADLAALREKERSRGASGIKRKVRKSKKKKRGGGKGSTRQVKNWNLLTKAGTGMKIQEIYNPIPPSQYN